VVASIGPTAGTGAAAMNPIVLENQQPGTTSWQFTDYNKETAHEIEGYASLTSVNKGDQISFMVSLSSSAQYTMDFYRMGWYPTGTNPDGSSCAPSCGGRLMQHVEPLSGFKQAACPRVTTSTDANFGMTECNWTPSYTLMVPTAWTTGNYLVKLKRLDGTQLENYMTFVVRDDSSTAPIVYSLDVNTWQAYNFWGGAGNANLGINLYGRLNDVTFANASGSRAYTVSFDRPYLDQGSIDGAGNLMVWDFPLIRWMESQGYDMTYVTDVDLESNPNLFNGHRAFVNTGHDEYFSDGMRSRIANAISAGVNMAFFSANNIYYRVTWGANGSGAGLRRIHCDKGAQTGLATVEWRNLSPAKPENAILGVMLNGVATSRPYLVSDASSWIYAGSGLSTYTGNGTTGVITSGPGQNALPGLVGYEFDTRAVNGPLLSAFSSSEPPGVTQVGHSFVPAADNGVSAWSDATLYTAPSGAIVFSAGTLQWPYGLDNGFADGFCDCDHNVANGAAQKVTANILNRFVGPATPAPAVSFGPTSLTFGSQAVGTTSASQSVTLTNTGTAPLTMSGVGLGGTNAGDYVQSSTCPLAPSTLAANGTCTISVTFAPTAAGTRTASVTIADDAGDSPQSVALTGTGTTPAPAVSLTPTSLGFGSQLVGTSGAAQTSTLKNTGSGPLTISGIALAGANPGDFTQASDCPLAPATLAAGASCAISVTFKPTASGSRGAGVTITDNAVGSPHSVVLSGTGTAPAVSLTPGALSFASQVVGTTSAAQTSTVRNAGTAPLTISSIGLSGGNPGDYAQSSDCPIGPTTLAVNATCTISVSFKPTAPGSRPASVTIGDDAANSPQTVALSGTGAAAGPAVSLTPTSIGFGPQRVGTTSGAQTSTLRNTGTAPLTISSIGLSGANAGDFAETSDCPFGAATLAVDGTCTISVTFVPTVIGARSASVTIGDDAADSPQSLGLSGTGTAPAVSLTPTALGFASSQVVGTTSAAQTATLRNTGTAALAISSIGLTGTNAGDYGQTNTCPSSPATLAVNGTCTVSVTFTPTATGSRIASLTVGDDADDNPQSVGLSGGGVAAAPAATLTPTSLGFGSQLVGGSSAAQISTLRNAGTAPLTIASIGLAGANPGDFTQSSDCPLSPATLPAGASCTISARFAPSALGSRSASVTISDDAPGSPHTLALSGSGTNTAIAFDKNLGKTTDNVSRKTITLTTSAAAASRSRAFVFVNWNNGTRTLASVTGGGLSWTIDRQAKDTSNYRGAIASADAPAGLPSGTVITATFSAAVTHGLIAAASFTGIASTSPLDAANNCAQGGVAAWTCSVTTTNASDLVLGWSGIDANTTSTAAAPNTEIHDFGDVNYHGWATSAYRIESSSGSKTVNGSWLAATGATANVTVVAAYKAG
jgi:hypothetical protein